MATVQERLPKAVLDRLGHLKGRVALITGASRGIGRECALALASLGCNVVIAAKSDTPQPTLPGTIYTVADECRRFGVEALSLKVDVRTDAEEAIAKTIEVFGRIDILINNASALWWKNIEDTPMKRYDLINEVNARGTFSMTRAALPHMKKAGYGHVINMSPPIDLQGIGGRTGYTISKYGMTIVALGVADENYGKGIAGNSLWPKTVVESLAAENFELGNRAIWRKATVISDAVLVILSEHPNDPDASGNMYIDEDCLRKYGVTNFVPYRCDPDVEPPSMADIAKSQGKSAFERDFARKRKPDPSKLNSKL